MPGRDGSACLTVVSPWRSLGSKESGRWQPTGLKAAETDDGAGTGAPAETPRSGFRERLIIGTPIFLALFFVEYPPLFLLGYWTWSAFVHKTLSGVFLILNLVLAQYASGRLSRGPGGPAASTETGQERTGEPGADDITARESARPETLT